jgi:hypothetical protein
VRFLPTWDAALLVHARRTGVLPERYRPLIFTTKMPQSVGTFLVDGAVAGTWRYDDGRVRWEAFERIGRADAREVDDEAQRLAVFHDYGHPNLWNVKTRSGDQRARRRLLSES